MLTMVSAQISLTETLQQILLNKDRETSQRNTELLSKTAITFVGARSIAPPLLLADEVVRELYLFAGWRKGNMQARISGG